MKIEKLSLVVLCFIVCLVSCGKDDGSNDVPTVVLRDRTEQQQADNDSIIQYLSTHYYNKGFFEQNTDFNISDIIITQVEESQNISSDADSLLINAVEKPEVNFAETTYQYYILRLNQGGGDKKPNFSDTVRLLYEGFLFDGTVFDGVQNPIDFDLTQLIPGWRKVIPQFNIAESFVESGDGTVEYFNGGLGVMFLPSGLAYFASPTASIPSYTPIIFKFEVLQAFENDHDNDGIPSHLEDLNGDGEFTASTDESVDDDDTDDDSIPNYFDADDDGDRIPTRDELESMTYIINNGDPEPEFDEEMEFVVSRTVGTTTTTIKTLKIVDSNNDGIGDYLDKDIKVENNNN